MDGRKFLRRFGIAAAALMALAAGLVALFDPFYHFHGQLAGDEGGCDTVGISMYRNDTEF